MSFTVRRLKTFTAARTRRVWSTFAHFETQEDAYKYAAALVNSGEEDDLAIFNGRGMIGRYK